MNIANHMDRVSNKKIANIAQAICFNGNEYDDCFYFIVITMAEILESIYYFNLISSRLHEEEPGEMNLQDSEAHYLLGIIYRIIDIDIIKLLETRKDTWNINKLYKLSEQFQWSDYREIGEKIATLKKDAKYIFDARNKLHAHTGDNMKSNILVTQTDLPIEKIQLLINIIDCFTNGTIPYIYQISDTQEVNLRDYLKY